MPIRVHILSDGFRAPNARAFVFPVIKHERAIRKRGFDVRIHAKADDRLTDCDALLIDARYFSGAERGQSDYMRGQLSAWRERLEALAWCDTSDSAGRVYGEVFDHVRCYLKSQVLSDADRYLKPMYGRRAFTDYYHRTVGICDENEETGDHEPQISDPAHLRKLAVSWNAGLADYSFLAPYRYELYQRAPWARWLLRYPWSFVDPGEVRPVPVSCRISTRYARASVAHQRQQVLRQLVDRLPVGRLSRRAFFRELARSRIVVSPFGWGEINYRDFEAFLAGAMVLKPNMDHIRTWPAFFEAGETYASFSWNLEDLQEVLDAHLDDDIRRQTIAGSAQARYREHVTGPLAAERFADRFARIVRRVVTPEETAAG